MSKFTLRDAQTAIAGLADTQNNILAAIQALANGHAAAPTPPPVQNANLVAPIPGAAVGPHTRVEQQVALANRTGTMTAKQEIPADDDAELRQIPEDKPDREGPAWATGVLNNKHGLFPRMKRAKNTRTGALEIVRYPVAPPDRSHFMANASGRPFGLTITLSVPDGKGGEQIAQFPAVVNLTAKEFSSYDHGLYGQIQSVDIVLPDGSEFTLAGQMNLQLKKRKN
jgi:hypothetical protein